MPCNDRPGVLTPMAQTLGAAVADHAPGTAGRTNEYGGSSAGVPSQREPYRSDTGSILSVGWCGYLISYASDFLPARQTIRIG